MCTKTITVPTNSIHGKHLGFVSMLPPQLNLFWPFGGIVAASLTRYEKFLFMKSSPCDGHGPKHDAVPRLISSPALCNCAVCGRHSQRGAAPPTEGHRWRKEGRQPPVRKLRFWMAANTSYALDMAALMGLSNSSGVSFSLSILSSSAITNATASRRESLIFVRSINCNARRRSRQLTH